MGGFFLSELHIPIFILILVVSIVNKVLFDRKHFSQKMRIV